MVNADACFFQKDSTSLRVHAVFSARVLQCLHVDSVAPAKDVVHVSAPDEDEDDFVVPPNTLQITLAPKSERPKRLT